MPFTSTTSRRHINNYLLPELLVFESENSKTSTLASLILEFAKHGSVKGTDQIEIVGGRGDKVRKIVEVGDDILAQLRYKPLYQEE